MVTMCSMIWWGMPCRYSYPHAYMSVFTRKVDMSAFFTRDAMVAPIVTILCVLSSERGMACVLPFGFGLATMEV